MDKIKIQIIIWIVGLIIAGIFAIWFSKLKPSKTKEKIINFLEKYGGDY